MEKLKENEIEELTKYLMNLGYEFTTVTPESHRRVLERQPTKPENELQGLRDLFGWNRSVDASIFSPGCAALLRNTYVISESDGTFKSTVRFSTIGQNIFIHSAYPTTDKNSVFFGPDSYRFVRFVESKIQNANTVIDIGCGSGVGGICLADHLQKKGHSVQLILTDINERALEYAKANAKFAGLPAVEVFESNLFAKIPKGADVVIANPPFIIDSEARAYRDGGKNFGTALSTLIVESALSYLAPGGTLALYTGTCFVNGRDVFYDSILPLVEKFKFTYEELDPDIFGEELSLPAYQQVERLAAVGLVVKK